jgi:chromosome segregation ATPase
MKIVAMTFICLAAAPAVADEAAAIASAPNLLIQLDAAKIDEATAAASLKTASEKAASAKKERQSLSDELKQLTDGYAAHNTKTKALRDTKLAPYEAAVARHNSNCPSGVSPNVDLVARCHDEIDQLTAWRRRLDPEINALKMEGAALDKRRDPVLKRMQELDASVRPLAESEAAALATRQAAADRVEGLVSQVAAAYSLCQTLRAKPGADAQSESQEAIRLCDKVQWDKVEPGSLVSTNARPLIQHDP